MIKYDCPICLFSSGIISDGKGTKCKTCFGSGFIGKTKINKLHKIYGDLINIKKTK